MKKFFEIIDLIVGTINQTMAVVGLSLGVLLSFINVTQLSHIVNHKFLYKKASLSSINRHFLI